MVYAELFCQSNFSFLTGASHPEELVIQADFLRYHAIAITDECSLAGVVRAHTAIKQQQLGIKQIVGSLFQLNDECRFVLLCPNQDAYAELCRIITNARRRSEKGQYKLSEWDVMSARHCLVIWLPSHTERDKHWGNGCVSIIPTDYGWAYSATLGRKTTLTSTIAARWHKHSISP